MTDDERPIADLGFEEALEQLETIVAELEAGQIELDRMLERFERAMGLRKRCAELLAQAEAKIQQLVDEEGTTEPFAAGETNADQA